MKKIFTLLVASLVTLVVFANHRPMVTVKSTRNFEIVIDGKSYYSQHGNTFNIPNLNSGRHTVRVFEINRSLFRSTRKLVSSAGFRLKNKDVAITVDRFGQLRIIESRYGKEFGRDNRHDDDWGHDRDNDRDGRGRNNRF
jgi:hypothetical protein